VPSTPQPSSSRKVLDVIEKVRREQLFRGEPSARAAFSMEQAGKATLRLHPGLAGHP
jgi:hypothetical protein